jgi:ribonucleoside-diphosphate reductase alpha chain
MDGINGGVTKKMLTKSAEALLLKRYAHKGETVEAIFKRVAKAIAIRDQKFEEELYQAMINGIFLPNSPCIRNAGIKKGCLSACFVLPVDDSISGIYQTLTNMAMVFQRGGGVGINFSPLRPKDAPLSSGGTSSGAVSFMDIFDATTEVVKSGGFRRGAAIFVLDVNHLDIEEFCQAKLKGKLQNANLSVLVNDEFMKSAVKNKLINLTYADKIKKEVNASNILDLMSFGAWVSGDPGILFYDRINKDNPKFPDIKINCCNPCGEVPTVPWGACVLGSLNLTKFIHGDSFDFMAFETGLILSTRALLNVNTINVYPITQIQKMMHELNSIGVGIMGFADALIMLGIYYDSKECLDFIGELGKRYVKITNEIASDSFLKRSIAPTGSLSILADCSSGIEPIFSRSFQRELVVGTFHEERKIYQSKYCHTAYEIEPEWHLKIQAKWQEYIDQGVSKTINCPSDTTVSDIKKIYIQAWKMGVKGVTIFRDKSIEGVLKPINTCDGEVCYL